MDTLQWLDYGVLHNNLSRYINANDDTRYYLYMKLYDSMSNKPSVNNLILIFDWLEYGNYFRSSNYLHMNVINNDGFVSQIEFWGRKYSLGDVRIETIESLIKLFNWLLFGDCVREKYYLYYDDIDWTLERLRAEQGVGRIEFFGEIKCCRNMHHAKFSNIRNGSAF